MMAIGQRLLIYLVNLPVYPGSEGSGIDLDKLDVVPTPLLARNATRRGGFPRYRRAAVG